MNTLIACLAAPAVTQPSLFALPALTAFATRAISTPALTSELDALWLQHRRQAQEDLFAVTRRRDSTEEERREAISRYLARLKELQTRRDTLLADPVEQLDLADLTPADPMHPSREESEEGGTPA